MISSTNDSNNNTRIFCVYLLVQPPLQIIYWGEGSFSGHIETWTLLCTIIPFLKNKFVYITIATTHPIQEAVIITSEELELIHIGLTLGSSTNSMAYKSRRFNSAFTRALQQFLSWAEWTQIPEFIPISLRSILILSSHLNIGLPEVSFL